MATTKATKKVYTPREIANLAVEHERESKRLIELKKRDCRWDPVFKECEEKVQRLEIELLKCGAWG